MVKATIKPDDADLERIRTSLVDHQGGQRAVDLAAALGINQQRVADRLAHGRKTGLFLVCHVGFTVIWFSCAHARIVRERHQAALQVDLERRRARSRAQAEALRAARVDEDDIDLLPVRRVVRRTWDPVPAAPGPVSVFTLGDALLRNC